MSTDAKWTVGTGMGIAALLIALMLGQFGTVNSRFDDVHARFGDITGRLDNMQADIREIRSMLFTLIQNGNIGHAQGSPEGEGSLK